MGNSMGDPAAIVSNFMPGHSDEWLISEDREGARPTGWDATPQFIIL
jgi:hypothetical protein